MENCIRVQGARVNNLKNISVEIPRDKLVVLTGLSGSGKSSLAFDTIFAEGQRRYVESLSSYARMFLGQMDKPDVDAIDGLSPAISIDQKTTSRNPRSTVGTVTEIYDYLRLLWARCGTPHCPKCGKEIRRQTIDQIVDQIMGLPERTKFQILSPVVRGKKGEHQKVFDDARRGGYARVRVDGSLYELTEEIPLDKNKKHHIEVVIDRLIMKPDLARRLTDSVETASNLSGGLVILNELDGDKDTLFSQNYACEDCGISMPELSPRMFSFNNPYGACPVCSGLGTQQVADPLLIIPDRSKSILQGAIQASGWNNVRDDSISRMYFEALAKKYHFSLNDPIESLPQQALDVILYGTGTEKLTIYYERANGRGTLERPFEGVVNNVARRLTETQSDAMRKELEECMSERPCPKCHGKRLSDISLAVTVGGMNIMDFCALPISEELKFIDSLKLTGGQHSKGNAFCNLIAIGRGDLGQRVLSGRQLFNIVGLVLGNPLCNRVAVLILDDQLSAGQLFTCGNVNLGDLYPGNIIPHDHRGIVQQLPFLPGNDPELLFILQIVDVCLVQLVAVGVRFALQPEHNIVCNGITISRPLFCQSVFFVKMQPRHTVRRVGGYPGVNNVVLRILDD